MGDYLRRGPSASTTGRRMEHGAVGRVDKYAAKVTIFQSSTIVEAEGDEVDLFLDPFAATASKNCSITEMFPLRRL